jgi:hypothetical protein
MSKEADARVEVVEKGNEVEAKLDKAFLFVPWKCAEYFCRVIHVIVVFDPVLRRSIRRCIYHGKQKVRHLMTLKATSGTFKKKASH